MRARTGNPAAPSDFREGQRVLQQHGLVAAWDFTSQAQARQELTGSGLVLRDGPGASVQWHPDPEVGGMLSFDGLSDHLVIPAGEVGALDVAARGREVTVAALIRRREHGTGFIAGMWQEHDDDPRRQYGLFVDLPVYGGAERVAGHVSRTGGPSPGLPYSRDYAASRRTVAPGSWRVAAFRYDGISVTAFLDGLADLRPEYTEPGAPLGKGLRYPKNPYRYEHGLNATSTSDFTIGAVLLTAGIGNTFAGDIARLAVWSRALGDDELTVITDAWTPAGSPLARLDVWQPAGDDSVAGGGHTLEVAPFNGIARELVTAVAVMTHGIDDTGITLTLTIDGVAWRARTGRSVPSPHGRLWRLEPERWQFVDGGGRRAGGGGSGGRASGGGGGRRASALDASGRIERVSVRLSRGAQQEPLVTTLWGRSA